MNPNEFKCARCGGIFEKAWSDEEALAEAEGFFGTLPPESMTTICDDCFQEIHPEKFPHKVEEAVAEEKRKQLKKQ